ncbi:MAG: hypothetical protein JW809_19705 [Pirellulales bacterium]|nr:hypothetical protein [Pirellulales bacterium]
MTLFRMGCLVAVLGAAALARADATVALRMDDGRFLRPAEDGVLRPGPRCPGEEDTFDLEADSAGRVVLTHARGRVAVFGPPGARQLRIGAANAADATLELPGAKLAIVPVEGNRVALGCGPAGELVRFAAPPESPPDPGGRPDRGRTIAIFHVVPIPDATRAMLAQAISALVAHELAGKTYDKTRRRKKEEYVTLPAPTLKDPRRVKRRRVLATDEETRVRAELDGQPSIAIPRMAVLKGYRQPGQGALTLAVDAEVPVLGRVGYKIPRVLDASTNFRARVRLSLTSQITAVRSGATVTLNPPEVLAMEVRLLSLNISNDLLNSARKAIRDLANEELRRKEAKIREQANKAIRKAIDSREFRLPLLRYLLEPGDETAGEATSPPSPSFSAQSMPSTWL